MGSNIFVLLIVSYFVSIGSANYISLDGNEWTAISFNKSIKVKARVPGSIYSDLQRGAVLKENIYFGDNDMNYRWVSYDNWTYERTFNVDSSLISRESVNLVANGIDTVSTVYINDKIVGKTDNQFIRYKFNVKNAIKSGQNTIRLAFESAPLYSLRKAKEYENKYKYIVFPDCDKKSNIGVCHPNFIRKMASSYSWDWGPAFPTQGIWKSIGIEAHNKPIIRDITVETTPDNTYTHWTLTVNTFVDLTAKQKTEAIFSIELDGNSLIKNSKHEIDSEMGETVKVKFVIPIKAIAITPWFPNGVANNTQKLYQLKVDLTFADSQEVSTLTKRIGFRKIELIQTPIKPEGLTFYFKVNGFPFYAKGTNWIPAHVLMEDLTPEYMRHLMGSTKDANMNMMRVWGGGVYESDLFYDLADEMGIMIWQDFMFACALYPSNPEFLQSVHTEVETEVRRLQHHPSIAIWSGNNENELVISAFFKGSKQYSSDYFKLFVDDIMAKVLLEDNTRPFVSSSPSNGLESIKEDYLAKNPNDNRYGDVHFYNDGAKLWDWKTYPSAKFASEYGFQSYPSLETLSEAIRDKDLVFPVSEAVKHHQRHPGGTESIQYQISHYLKLPSNGGKDKFNELIYLSQITQAMAMKTETEFYRRNREIDPKTGNGYTMGALYWQLNDIWQGPTWASIEFGGKWKALHYFAKNFMNNLLVSPYEDTNQILKVSLVRDDYLGELEFDLSIKVYKWSENKPIHEINEKIKTNSFSAKVVYTKSIPDLLKESKCVDRTECVLSFEVKNSGKKLEAHNFMLLTEPKNCKLHKPNLKVVECKKLFDYIFNHVFEIKLTSEAIAPFVLLDFKEKSGIKGQLGDNGFFIFNGEKSIQFITTDSKVTEQQIKDNLRVMTITDVA